MLTERISSGMTLTIPATVACSGRVRSAPVTSWVPAVTTSTCTWWPGWAAASAWQRQSKLKKPASWTRQADSGSLAGPSPSVHACTMRGGTPPSAARPSTRAS